MATIVNTPRTTGDNGMGFLLGVVLLIAFVIFLFAYGLPYLSQSFSRSGPQVTIPSQVDVNVHQK